LATEETQIALKQQTKATKRVEEGRERPQASKQVRRERERKRERGEGRGSVCAF
jgi:hypothetical protein